MRQGEDLHALSLVFLELCFSGLSALPPPQRDARGRVTAAARAAAATAWAKEAGGPFLPGPSDAATFSRLLGSGIFAGDVAALRAFCAEEPAWAPALALLDERAGAQGEGALLGDGWELIALLFGARGAGAGVGPAPDAGPRLGESFLDPGATVTARALLASPFFTPR